MKRFLIFTLLFPPLVGLVYVVADGLLLEGVPGFGFIIWLLRSVPAGARRASHRLS
jgi:hypothetical protein